MLALPDELAHRARSASARCAISLQPGEPMNEWMEASIESVTPGPAMSYAPFASTALGAVRARSPGVWLMSTMMPPGIAMSAV